MKKGLVIAVSIMIMFMVISLAIIYMPKATATPANAKYVSDKKCYFCHKKQAKDHIKSAHAKSFDSLAENGQEDNAKCLPCHTTGYGKPGGFVDANSTPDMMGVGCQSCHGPGSAHVENGLSKLQKRQTIGLKSSDSCLNCHEIHKEHIDIKKRK